MTKQKISGESDSSGPVRPESSVEETRERLAGVCPMFCVRSGVTDAAVGAGKAIHDQAEDQVQ
jgi:hypothetical protein